MPPFRKKSYRLHEQVRDVWALRRYAGNIAAVWLRGRIDPATREQLMLAVAGVNQCRYCTWAHHAWALHEGAGADDLLRIERGETAVGGAAQAAALSYVRALAESDFAAPPAALEEHLAQFFDAGARDDLIAVARVMAFFNRTTNTLDALLSRLRGNPDPQGQLFDELVIALGVALGGPPVVLYLLLRGSSPRELWRSFRSVSEQLRPT